MTNTHACSSLFIYGASGHAKVVADIVERQGLYQIAFLVDDDPGLKGAMVYGYPVIGGKDDLVKAASSSRLVGGIVAIGSNPVRAKIATWLIDNDFELITAVHPAAKIARGVKIGPGSVVMAGAVINSDATIGQNVIVNTGATIDHDCRVEDGVHVAPGVTICGSVRVGTSSFVGAGAVIIPNLTIGRNVTVGAGATVVCDVPDDLTVVGTPARERGRSSRDF